MNVKSEQTAGTEREARPRTLKADQSEATRAALIGAARELFAARGYGAVATEEIVRTAGVTRGALYHHFAGKTELFEAVAAALFAVADGALGDLDLLHRALLSRSRASRRNRRLRNMDHGG